VYDSMARSKIIHVRVSENTYEAIKSYVERMQRIDASYTVSRFIKEAIIEKLLRHGAG